MVRHPRSTRLVWHYLAATCTLPLLLGSCEEAPAREDCVRLQQVLDDVSNGVSAWRCPADGVETAATIAAGNDQISCALYAECVGAFAGAGKFACGPKDCTLGTACVVSTNCDRMRAYSCTGSSVEEPCSEVDCTCSNNVCSSTGFSSCASGIDGDPWIFCIEYVCGSS